MSFRISTHPMLWLPYWKFLQWRIIRFNLQTFLYKLVLPHFYDRAWDWLATLLILEVFLTTNNSELSLRKKWSHISSISKILLDFSIWISFVAKNYFENGNPMNQFQILLQSLILMSFWNQVLTFENILHLELSLW